jgi:D-glycero-alpha-D-manno-heptose-7-phosphate kinase
VGATIDKYVYLYANALASIAPENIRFAYRDTQSVQDVNEIVHPVFREMYKYLKITSRMNIGTFADFPSSVGLGGSSSFTVGLAQILKLSRGENVSPRELAKIAVEIERKILSEAGGYQDQYHAAVGGFRQYRFSSENVEISEPLLPASSLRYVEDRQILISTGVTRDSDPHARFTRSRSGSSEVQRMAELALRCAEELKNSLSPQDSYGILSEYTRLGWEHKQKFSSPMPDPIGELGKRLLGFGADAVKLCGAGGGGFFLVMAEPENLVHIKSQMPHGSCVEFHFSSSGTQQIYPADCI